MREITYQIVSPLGIHARPAGQLMKEICNFKCTAIIAKDGKEVNAKKIIGLMSLGVKQSEKITITFDGEDEDIAATTIQKFLNENKI